MEAPRKIIHTPDPARQEQIILDVYRELQEVRKETREIRHILERGESWRNHLWRAVTNFVTFIKTDGKSNYHDKPD